MSIFSSFIECYWGPTDFFSSSLLTIHTSACKSCCFIKFLPSVVCWQLSWAYSPRSDNPQTKNWHFSYFCLFLTKRRYFSCFQHPENYFCLHFSSHCRAYIIFFVKKMTTSTTFLHQSFGLCPQSTIIGEFYVTFSGNKQNHFIQFAVKYYKGGNVSYHTLYTFRHS